MRLSLIALSAIAAVSCCLCGVNAGGAQQQIFQWFKTLSDKGFKSCDKKSPFEFNEEKVLIDNVPCKPKKRRVTKVFQFYDVDFKTELSKDTDDYLKGRGHLMLFNEKENNP